MTVAPSSRPLQWLPYASCTRMCTGAFKKKRALLLERQDQPTGSQCPQMGVFVYKTKAGPGVAGWASAHRVHCEDWACFSWDASGPEGGGGDVSRPLPQCDLAGAPGPGSSQSPCNTVLEPTLQGPRASPGQASSHVSPKLLVKGSNTPWLVWVSG